MEEDKIWGYSKKTLTTGLMVVVVAGGMFYAGAKYEKNKLSRLGLLKNGTEQVAKQKKQKTEATVGDVKEFSMTSFYDDKGKWFSLKEISVSKGDKVRIKVTNTKGTHDFNIDEYGIKQATPLNQETVIEFTADKVGTFEYYCSMPGHRAGGQVGKLIVK
jgi:nitrite reductase (NO-forming)